jgi:hypothetical protein
LSFIHYITKLKTAAQKTHVCGRETGLFRGLSGTPRKTKRSNHIWGQVSLSDGNEFPTQLQCAAPEVTAAGDPDHLTAHQTPLGLNCQCLSFSPVALDTVKFNDRIPQMPSKHTTATYRAAVRSNVVLLLFPSDLSFFFFIFNI